MRFVEELTDVLPGDLPNRANVIQKAAAHLELIVEANRQFNLTRILDPREAAIKHIVDSVTPWQLFASATQILDVGTGAGFPGIPLALVLPNIRFVVTESIGKKARFVAFAVQELGLTNVEVAGARAEEVLRTQRSDLVTARAVAPIGRFAGLIAPAMKTGGKALLYKGPDAETEIVEAGTDLKRAGLRAGVAHRYDLPDGAGTRTIVEIRAR